MDTNNVLLIVCGGIALLILLYIVYDSTKTPTTTATTTSAPDDQATPDDGPQTFVDIKEGFTGCKPKMTKQSEGFVDVPATQTVPQTETQPTTSSDPKGFPGSDQVLVAQDLLPIDADSPYAQINPNGQGSIDDVNLIQAGYHIGVDTKGSTNRNANLQLRSEPPNPTTQVSPWNQSTIEADINQRHFEIGN